LSLCGPWRNPRFRAPVLARMRLESSRDPLPMRRILFRLAPHSNYFGVAARRGILPLAQSSRSNLAGLFANLKTQSIFFNPGPRSVAAFEIPQPDTVRANSK